MVDVGGGVSLVSQATGYGLVVGLSVLFCLVILAAVRIQKVYLLEDSGKSEMFMVANRSVGKGLTASAVFSSWMWINETVFSCVYCWKYGIAASMWFGTGVCFQVAFMGVVGVLSKIRVPFAHTSLEIIRLRYGKEAHFIFTCLNLINNIFGCSSMVLAGSQLLVGISGIHLAAATILIPVGVVLYTAVGGLKATFLTDYLHTAIALFLIIFFTCSTLASPHIGGLYGLYDKLIATAGDNYIVGNYKGSLLSFKSKGAIMFGIILKFGNFSLIMMDTAFWQKSFASEVSATVPGYDLAAIAVFGMPWGIGTVIGLAARVLYTLPDFPTYPNIITDNQVNSGFVMPYVIKTVLGTGGVVGLILMIFMAVTSTVSSSMIAVSSIISFDMYKTYIKPFASDKQVVRVSHFGVLFHGIFIAGFALALNYGGANQNWINYFQPILASGGVVPMILTLTWSGQTKLAACVAPVLGLTTGVAVWIGTAYSIYGELTITTTSMQAPSLYGSIASMFSPALYSIIISYVWPKTFDWREFLRVELVEDSSGTSSPTEGDTGVQTPVDYDKGVSTVNTVASPQPELNEKGETTVAFVPPTSTTPRKSLDELVHPLPPQTLEELARWYKISWAVLILIILVTCVAWPFPLYRDWIFTRAFFSGWVTVAIIWQCFAFCAIVLYPLYDGRHEIAKGARGVWRSTRQYVGK